VRHRRSKLRRRYGHSKRTADYEVTVERTVMIRGRTKPNTYEAVVTVYNAPSAIAAKKAVHEKIVSVRRLP
jgi:hypothetical protein